MSIAKVIEISARSDESFEAAAKHGIAEASKTVHNIQEAWVNEMKIQITDGQVTGYQVAMKLTFVVDSAS
jgi:dodecin